MCDMNVSHFTIKVADEVARALSQVRDEERHRVILMALVAVGSEDLLSDEKPPKETLDQERMLLCLQLQNSISEMTYKMTDILREQLAQFDKGKMVEVSSREADMDDNAVDDLYAEGFYDGLREAINTLESQSHEGVDDIGWALAIKNAIEMIGQKLRNLKASSEPEDYTP